MIDIEVEKLASDFINKYSFPQDSNGLYKLDLSLYSCCLLDFILDFNFLPHRKQKIEEELLYASAYVGLCLNRILSLSNKSLVVDIKLSEHPSKEIKLTISEIPEGNTKKSTLNVTTLLKKMYVTKDLILESLKGQEIHLALKSRPMLPVLLGIALCNSNYIEGPLADVDEQELKIHYYNAFEILGLDIEDKLKASNPLLSNLNLRPIINPALVGPIMGHQENSFGQRAISLLMKGVESSNLDAEQLEHLSRSLLKMPDINLSSLGFVLSSSGDNPLKSLKELGEFSLSYPILVSSLRGIHQFLRSKNGSQAWELLFTGGDIENAWTELDIEVSCGLLPFIFAWNLEDILNLKHFVFFDLLAYGKIKEALSIVKKLPDLEQNGTLLLNLILHLLLSGKVIEAKTYQQKLASLNSEPSIKDKLNNCIDYFTASASNDREALVKHHYEPIPVSTLWNLNHIYLKLFIEDRRKYDLPLDPQHIPTTEEEGLSLSTEFHNFLANKSIIRTDKLRFSASPYSYWLEAIKLIAS